MVLTHLIMIITMMMIIIIIIIVIIIVIIIIIITIKIIMARLTNTANGLASIPNFRIKQA